MFGNDAGYTERGTGYRTTVANPPPVPRASDLAPVFRLEPELLEGLDPRVLPRFQNLSVPTFEPPRGRWRPPRTDDTFAYMVIEGVVARETRIPGKLSIELIGAGDIVLLNGDADSYLPSAQHWERLSPARVAVFEEPVLTALPGASPVVVALGRRAAERTDRNLVQLTISSVHPIKRRLELLLWHLAERWGFRRAGAIELPLRLTHGRLAALTSTSRETVCKAMVELVAAGVLEELPQHQVRLVGLPPSQDLISEAQENLRQVIVEREGDGAGRPH